MLVNVATGQLTLLAEPVEARTGGRSARRRSAGARHRPCRGRCADGVAERRHRGPRSGREPTEDHHQQGIDRAHAGGVRQGHRSAGGDRRSPSAGARRSWRSATQPTTWRCSPSRRSPSASLTADDAVRASGVALTTASVGRGVAEALRRFLPADATALTTPSRSVINSRTVDDAVVDSHVEASVDEANAGQQEVVLDRAGDRLDLTARARGRARSRA